MLRHVCVQVVVYFPEDASTPIAEDELITDQNMFDVAAFLIHLI